jgi:tRNA-Thr(GGU) m(6)t(6)A37 methyltransferase TsaA
LIKIINKLAQGFPAPFTHKTDILQIFGRGHGQEKYFFIGTLHVKDFLMNQETKIQYRPIGIIHSPHLKPGGTPIQPCSAKGIRGTVEVYPRFQEGLKDIDGFSHLILLYHFHLVKDYQLKAVPFMEDREHGIFAIRGPARPNPIGLSVVRLIQVRKNILTIEDIDIVDGTPLLDIKPYVPQMDIRDDAKIGWLEKAIHKMPHTLDDERFL